MKTYYFIPINRLIEPMKSGPHEIYLKNDILVDENDNVVFCKIVNRIVGSSSINIYHREESIKSSHKERLKLLCQRETAKNLFYKYFGNIYIPQRYNFSIESFEHDIDFIEKHEVCKLVKYE